MKKYAYVPITKLEVYKVPLSGYLQTASKLLTQNNTGQAVLMHVGLLVTLENGTKIMIEKNETVIITDKYTQKPDTEYMDVPLKGIPLNLYQLLGRAVKEYGPEHIFKYSALENRNCQNFTLELLRASNLWNQDLQNFAYQDLTVLNQNLPGLAKKFVNLATNTAALYSNIMGKGQTPTQGCGHKKKKLYTIHLTVDVFDDETLETRVVSEKNEEMPIETVEIVEEKPIEQIKKAIKPKSKTQILADERATRVKAKREAQKK
jgi:hypothetical protein